MLAYIFWHRPYPNTERQRYEQAILHFQSDLAGSKPPGFIGATSFQIEAVPWLSDLPGYEDWYLLDGTWGHGPAQRVCHIWPRSGAPRQCGRDDGARAWRPLRPCRRREYAGAAFHDPLADAPARHSVAAGDRGGARQLSAGEGLAATDGFGTGGRVCRRNPGRSGDRRAGRLAASPRDADAPAARTCMSLRKFPSTCSLGRRRTPLGASKCAGASGARCSDHLDASNHRPSGNVSGSAVRNRDVNRDLRASADHRPSTIANVSGTAVDATRPSAKFPPKKKFEASSPADVPPSRRAHRDGRGDRGPNTGDGPLAECPLLGRTGHARMAGMT